MPDSHPLRAIATRPSRTLPALLLIAMLVPATAAAQANLFRTDAQRSGKAEVYDMVVRNGINQTTAAYLRAWERDDADALAKLYLEDATLFTEEGMIVGRVAIADYFRRVLPTLSDLRTRPLHFDASGVLAYQVNQVTVRVEGPSEPGERLERVFILFRQERDDWLIEAHGWSEIDEAATAGS